MKNQMRKAVLILIITITCTKMYAQIPKWETSDKTLFTVITKNGNTGYVQKSSDGGFTWNTVWDGEMDAQTGQNRLFGIASGNGTIVAVGNIIITSKDGGQSWTETEMKGYAGNNIFSNRSALSSIAYGNGFFVAAGPFQFLYSKDGINWKYVRTGEMTGAEISAAKNPSGLSLEDIAKDPKLHGKRPSVGEFPPEIHPGLKVPRHVLHAGGKFYVSGGNGLMTGKILTIEGDKIVVEKDMAFTGNGSSLNSGGLQRMAWDGKSTIFATSISTKSAYSTDMGETWKYMFNPNKNQIWAVAYHEGSWVAASPFEDIFYSNDLQNFESLKRAGGRAAVQDMIYANDRFLLVGTDNQVFGSLDGKQWELLSKKVYGMKIQAITYHDN